MEGGFCGDLGEGDELEKQGVFMCWKTQPSSNCLVPQRSPSNYRKPARELGGARWTRRLCSAQGQPRQRLQTAAEERTTPRVRARSVRECVFKPLGPEKQPKWSEHYQMALSMHYSLLLIILSEAFKTI